MKVYIGTTVESGRVYVSENGERRELPGGPFTWGDRFKALPSTADLAKSILVDILGEPILASRLYRRFMWRLCVAWGDTWAYTADELMAVVKTVQEAEGATATARAQAATAIPPVVSDSGVGDIARAPVEWDNSGQVGVVRPGPTKKLEG